MIPILFHQIYSFAYLLAEASISFPHKNIHWLLLALISTHIAYYTDHPISCWHSEHWLCNWTHHFEWNSLFVCRSLPGHHSSVETIWGNRSIFHLVFGHFHFISSVFVFILLQMYLKIHDVRKIIWSNECLAPFMAVKRRTKGTCRISLWQNALLIRLGNTNKVVLYTHNVICMGTSQRGLLICWRLAFARGFLLRDNE